MKVEDSKALKEYQEKLKRARCTGNLIDPDESLTVRMNRIQRAKRDVKYLVETYLPLMRPQTVRTFKSRMPTR